MGPLIIIQARRGSSRLPNKVVAPLCPHTVIEQVIRRCQMSRKAGGVVVATTTEERDAPVAEIAARLGAGVFRGSEANVLSRFVGAGEQFGAEVIVRITADCPLVDPVVIDEAIALYERSQPECVYAYVDGYPNGVGDAEVARLAALRQALAETESPRDVYCQEHATTYLLRHPEKFRLVIVKPPVALFRPELRLSVDEAADLEAVRAVQRHFAPRLDFGVAEIIEFLDQHPEVVALNRHVRQLT